MIFSPTSVQQCMSGDKQSSDKGTGKSIMFLLLSGI